MGVQLLELAEVPPQRAGRLDVAVGAYPQEKVHGHGGPHPLAVGALDYVYPGPLACEGAVTVCRSASWRSKERSHLPLQLPPNTEHVGFHIVGPC